MPASMKLLGKDVVVDLAQRCSVLCPMGMWLCPGHCRHPKAPCQLPGPLSVLVVASALQGLAAGSVHWHREPGHLTSGD